MTDAQSEALFSALEVEVAELLALLQDRQPGMRTIRRLTTEHLDRIAGIADKLKGKAS